MPRLVISLWWSSPPVPLIWLRSVWLRMLLQPDILGLQQLDSQWSGVRSLRVLEMRMPVVSSRICRAYSCLEMCRSRPLATEHVEEQWLALKLVVDIDLDGGLPLQSSLDVRRELRP